MTHCKPSLLVRSWRTLMGREDGNATIEFAILFPGFMLVFMSIFEIGMLMTRYMMFDRALDVAIREVRLSENRSFTQDQVKQLLCSQTVILRNHCLEDVSLEMVRVDEDDQNWTFPTGATPCRDYAQNVIPTTTFVTGDANDLIFVRACMSIEPFFPTAALGEYLTRDSGGRLNMIAMSAFSVEPN
ncbi:TadE/TadG family type IV pilus assembly protein [Litoreibacter janthinus]|uniref:TadE-like protein n=1 Tax=Litoreibacter janthinus TaxID=670154 RepID=A0A1I6HNQ9_9RHOB|nr:TadE family protein [Litoreibacter janthinus]SFR56079.1 TadE-like protein [Litoreibacter janthinus]